MAGQRYYFEVLHKTGTGTGDNWAIGWLQDPTGTNTAPSGVVPSYVLSRYFAPPPALLPGTLYAATDFGVLAYKGGSWVPAAAGMPMVETPWVTINQSTHTLYAGTGEPNASSDSESGVGIYASTNNGNSWTLLPGSTVFNARSISSIVVDPNHPGTLYVGDTRGVRGVTGVNGGAVSLTGTGKGSGGPSVRQKRVMRWSMTFNTQSGDDYARQLAGIKPGGGAVLAIPLGNGKYEVIRSSEFLT